jgi:hypothetical protein
MPSGILGKSGCVTSRIRCAMILILPCKTPRAGRLGDWISFNGKMWQKAAWICPDFATMCDL